MYLCVEQLGSQEAAAAVRIQAVERGRRELRAIRLE